MADNSDAPQPFLPSPGPNFERDQWALALSGGGYKAAAFHLGALIRLNELGVLSKLRRVSSVSGGSIIAAYLGLNWRSVGADDFVTSFAAPFARFLNKITIDRWAILNGLTNPFQKGFEGVQRAYAKHLYGKATLQDLPDEEAGAPRFVINATNMRLNSLWRFSKVIAADHHVGSIEAPDFDLATVVTASSAFPPFFCPVSLDLPQDRLKPFADSDRFTPPFNSKADLGDGGIYDNMGLETVWKRFGILLVSNAGDPIDESKPTPAQWVPLLRRANSMIHRQAENNRVGELMLRASAGQYDLAYWNLRADGHAPAAPGGLALPDVEQSRAAAEKVRLRAMPSEDLVRLVRHGYARADGSVRVFLKVQGPAPVWPAVEGWL